MWEYDKAFHVLRCVLLHFNARACFRSRDLFCPSVTSRQFALISSHCCDVICVGWGLLNDMLYWILGVLKFLQSFCWLFIVVYTLFTCAYARNNILGGRKNPPYVRTEEICITWMLLSYFNVFNVPVWVTIIIDLIWVSGHKICFVFGLFIALFLWNRNFLRKA